jgi:transposase-like protein
MAHRQLLCPHCDSENVERLPDRPYETQSAMTWFKCRDCGRLWSVPKVMPPPASADGSPAPKA